MADVGTSRRDGSACKDVFTEEVRALPEELVYALESNQVGLPSKLLEENTIKRRKILNVGRGALTAVGCASVFARVESG
jgi:hypothetical protein